MHKHQYMNLQFSMYLLQVQISINTYIYTNLYVHFLLNIFLIYTRRHSTQALPNGTLFSSLSLKSAPCDTWLCHHPFAGPCVSPQENSQRNRLPSFPFHAPLAGSQQRILSQRRDGGWESDSSQWFSLIYIDPRHWDMLPATLGDQPVKRHALFIRTGRGPSSQAMGLIAQSLKAELTQTDVHIFRKR